MLHGYKKQGDHSPDNVKFPDISMMVHGIPAHVMCYSYHAGTSVIVTGGGRNATRNSDLKEKRKRTNSAKSRMDANMQLTINSFRQLFPDTSLTFSKIPDISLTTAVKIPDISRFSRQVVTLKKVTNIVRKL